jgi:hypothetical protein
MLALGVSMRATFAFITTFYFPANGGILSNTAQVPIN